MQSLSILMNTREQNGLKSVKMVFLIWCDLITELDEGDEGLLYFVATRA